MAPVVGNRRRAADKLPVMGWREWLALPDLGVPLIKAKIDTGARSSAIHAFGVETFTRRGVAMVRFCLHPQQRDRDETVEAEARVADERFVRSSAGHRQQRIVVVTRCVFLGEEWPVELTLASRDQMGFRMLLGRQATRGRYLVDPGRSFYGGRPARKRREGKT